MTENKKEEEALCQTCHTPLVGTYCHVCGEKKLSREDFTIKKFLTQTVDVLAHFDSKLFKSVYYLVARPGFLPYEYNHGRRVKYAKPIQIFFVLNIIYFLILNYIGFDTVTNPLKDHLDNFIYGSFATSMVDHKLQEQNLSMSEFETQFYNEIYVESKLLIFLMVPMFALCLMLLFYGSKFLYYEHLVFSTYFFSFILLFYTVFLNIFDYTVYYITEYNIDVSKIIEVDDFIATVIAQLTALAYLFLAFKKAYSISSRAAAVKAISAIVCLFIVANIYSFILFIIVYWKI
ncbi:MAG: DUF3667 domain-containing protein [bacterium]